MELTNYSIDLSSIFETNDNLDALKEQYNYDQDFIIILEEDDYFLNHKRERDFLEEAYGTVILEEWEQDEDDMIFVLDELRQMEEYVGILL